MESSALIFDLLAFTSILPLFPIIIDFYAKDPDSNCGHYDDISSGLLGSLFSALQFLSSPVLGALSDVYGRKPILIVSLCGSLCSYLLWYNASKFSIFVLSRVIGGISKASTSIYTAIISDLYSEQNVVGKGMVFIFFIVFIIITLLL
ncbi:unnamed protein product [Anisakis simplex]|uniref:Tetracycline-efflux transporter, putative (inferred by orthology to a S. mansoni protein) n=1 Tax=Anisakis simplex TaxID=6269 RepID=A0A0M3J3Q3_ANISI|nr:unnamed protein product [Anisakis simplex]